MKTRLRTVSALAFLSSVVAVSSAAHARPIRDVDPTGPIDPLPRPTRPPVVIVDSPRLDVQRQLVLDARFREMPAAEQAAQLQGAVPEAQANATLPEQTTDLGALDTAEETLPEYGLVKM